MMRYEKKMVACVSLGWWEWKIIETAWPPLLLFKDCVL